MPRKLKRQKARRKKRARKPANNLLKAPRRPLPEKLKRCIATHKCKVPTHIISARQPMKTEVRMHVKADVPWDLAVGIFGKHLQGHLRLSDKRARYGERVWVGSVLAVFGEGPGIRERLHQLGIKQSCFYQREAPKGDHLLFIKLPGSSAQWEQLPEATELLAMVPDILSPKDISYFIGPRHPRRIYNLSKDCTPGRDGTSVYPLLFERSKRGRILRPASGQDTGEVVAIYENFVRFQHLLGRTVSVSQEELESLGSEVPDNLRILPPDALYHLKKLRDVLADSAGNVVQHLKMAVGW